MIASSPRVRASHDRGTLTAVITIVYFAGALLLGLVIARRLAPSSLPARSGVALLIAAAGSTVMTVLGPANLLGLAFLGASALLGLLVCAWLFPALPPLARLGAAALVGMVLTTWATFLLALLFSVVATSVVAPVALLVLGGTAVAAWAQRRRLIQGWRRLSAIEVAVLAAALFFSVWLFSQAAGYDIARGELTVAHSTWADMALHIALARSFSWGDNLPPEYPFFAGQPIRYHFGYDFLAGTLEALGLRLDLAFNLPAVLGFAALLLLLFELARLIAGSALAGVFAALFVSFNSSLAFLDYLRRWGYNPLRLPEHIWQQATRLHVGPYDGQAISIYYTLNPYLNQRQLALAVALGVLIVLLLVEPLRGRKPLPGRQAVALGALLGLSFPLNGVVYLGVLAVASALFLLFWRPRTGATFLAPALALALPCALLLNGERKLGWLPDYLALPYTPLNFLRYWWLNLGLLLPLVALAAVFGSNTDRRLLLAFCAPFVFGSLVQLAADPGGINHKLFNLWIALMAAYAGVMLARLAAVRLARLLWIGAAVAAVLLVPLTFSGVIDAMVIKNDVTNSSLSDAPAVAWIAENTPGDAVFLTSAYLYLPPSVAGRRLYIGYPYFTATTGYDVEPRLARARRIYGGVAAAEVCPLLTEAGIDYVEVGPEELHPNSALGVNLGLWDQFPAAYDAVTRWGRLRYFRVADICSSP